MVLKVIKARREVEENTGKRGRPRTELRSINI
jgi:hypothetical protein